MRAWVRTLCAAALVVHFKLNNFHNMNMTAVRHEQNEKTLPPIYWINLDISTARRDAMLESFSSLGIYDNHFRIPAYDNIAAYELWHSGNLILHPKIRLEVTTKDPPTFTKHIKNAYHYEEAGCLLSHFRAIKQAYEAGDELALILEDDALLSVLFKDEWSGYVDQAPYGWKILQFATIMPIVMVQGVHLQDPFVNWQPYHWSTRAYIINRAGMRSFMDKIHSTASEGEDIWRIEEAPMVVSDEVLYTLIGDAYTSTGLWIDSTNSDSSTVQSSTKNSPIVHSYTSPSVGELSKKEPHNDRTHIYEESLLVLMNVRISNSEQIAGEIIRIEQDSHDVCKFHQNCKWHINVVAVNHQLAGVFQERASSTLPHYVQVHLSVSAEPFNKFSHVKKFIDDMAHFDLVLLKDNDQRISGFPWCSFIHKKEDAVVAGPLRQTSNEAMLHMYYEKKSQYFQFHEAHYWFFSSWSSELIAGVVPTEVPLLEMYFVLFDAKFAQHFFRLTLLPEFLDQRSSWGPDYLWCQAAKEWGNGRPGCYLVPVVSSHEDSRQIVRDDAFDKRGHEALKCFDKNPEFKRWMAAANKWARTIEDKNMHEIEQACHSKPQSCPIKTILDPNKKS